MSGTKKMGPPPIDRGWAWMISFGFFLNVFFMVGLAKSFGLIIIALIKEFGISTASAALPISVTLLVYAFGAPTAILIAQKFTIQKVVIIGGVIGFVGIALSSFLVSLTYFIMTFGLFYGIGNSCFYGNGMIIIGKYFRVRRSLANGLALSGASIGQFALPPLIEYLLENYNLSGTLLIVGALYLHGTVTGSLFRPIEQYDDIVTEVKTPPAENNEEKPMLTNGDGALETVDDNKGEQNHTDDKNLLLSKKDAEAGSKKDDGEDGSDSEDELTDRQRMILGSQGSIFMVSSSVPDLADENPKTLSKQDSRNFFSKIIDFRLLKNRVTIFFTVVSFFCFFGYFNFVLFLPGIVMEKGIKDYDKAFLISICGIGDLIARISIGFFADLNIISRYKIKALACLFCALNILMFVFANSFPWLAVHCFLYGFLGGGYVCMVAVVLVDFVGLANMGPNLAVVLFIQGIGSSAGNPILGLLRDVTGSFTIVSIGCALSLGLGAVLLFFYPVVRRLEAKRVQHLN